MTPTRTLATARRVLAQLGADHRSLVLMLVVPSLLIGLFSWIFSDRPGAFEAVGPALLILFPFVLMFLITSVTTLRERRSGTLERLMTMPFGRADFVLGYAVAFSLAAAAQAAITVGTAVWLWGLDVAGPVWLLGVVAVVNGILGSALGLLASAFARTEFQAVQFMPVLTFPQILLGGVMIARESMPPVLYAVSQVLPMSHAVDAAQALAAGQPTADVLLPVLIVAGFVVGSLLLATASLRRRTA